jgi:hypothetical protein
LMKKIIDEMNESAAGFGNFSDHIFIWRVDARRVCRPDPDIESRRAAARMRLGTGPCGKGVLVFQWRNCPRDGRRFLPSTGSGQGRGEASGGL